MLDAQPNIDDSEKTFVFQIETNQYMNVNDCCHLESVVRLNQHRMYLTDVVNNLTCKPLDIQPFIAKYQYEEREKVNNKFSSIFDGSDDIVFKNVDEVQTFSLTLNPLFVQDCIIQDHAHNRISVPCTQSYHLWSIIQSNNSEMEKKLVDMIRSVFCNLNHLEQVRQFLLTINATLMEEFDRVLQKYKALIMQLQAWSDEMLHMEQKEMVDQVNLSLDMSQSFPATAEKDNNVGTTIRDAVISILVSIRCGKKNTPITQPVVFCPHSVAQVLAISHERSVWKVYEQFINQNKPRARCE